MKSEKITIVLPDGREIKRKMYSKYIANNSPVWVVVNGIDFILTILIQIILFMVDIFYRGVVNPNLPKNTVLMNTS